MQCKIQKAIGPRWIWFTTNFPNTTSCNFPTVWGNMGVVPKSLESQLPTDLEPSQVGPLITKVQKYAIKASLKIWNLRNQKLFGRYNMHRHLTP